ncbi:MAG: C40 family peptidase [Chlorobi bacterium]|nr:C40 family peptidase [Chlorobiota bacterium]
MTNSSAVALIVIALALAGCASSVRYTQRAVTSGATPLQQQVLDAAAELVGTPYCRGGSTQRCYDCSGYVQAVFAAVGVLLPRSTLQQSYAGIAISRENLSAGDLVFFQFSGTKGRSHVGIYAGDGTIYHASESRGVVRERLWETYLERAIIQFRRVLTDSR